MRTELRAHRSLAGISRDRVRRVRGGIVEGALEKPRECRRVGRKQRVFGSLHWGGGYLRHNLCVIFFYVLILGFDLAMLANYILLWVPDSNRVPLTEKSMKKSLHLEISQARNVLGSGAGCGCSPHSPCLQCSMIRVISHRFAIFHKKFDRLPKPNDELFFDETLTYPVRASQVEIKNQIFAAAEAQGLNFFTLLTYLGLNSGGAHYYGDNVLSGSRDSRSRGSKARVAG